MTTRAARMLEGLPEALRPLLGELLDALASTLAEARAAGARGDAEEAGRAAHGLKGACMRFGLEELAAVAARAEESARAGELQVTLAALEAFSGLLGELSAQAR